MSRNPNDPPVDSQFELAANPLNSLNPPPRDLPNLFDRLLNSETLLQGRIKKCDELDSELESRREDLGSRLKNLRQKFPLWRADNPKKAQGPKDKNRLAFELQEELCCRMISQMTFLHSIAQMKLPLRLLREVGNCKDVFTEFLGDRHDHCGIEIANSAHLHCVDGCRWYFDNGPYEWTGKPYSNEWWAGMNQTDWDWVKVRKHIEDLIKDIDTNHLRAADEFQYHVREFVPSWFWKGDMQRWGLQTRVRVGKDQSNNKQLHMNVFVAYQKSQADIEQEHARKVAALIKQRVEEGAENPTDIDLTAIVIDPMGTFNINNDTVFDGQRLVADWEKAARLPGGSWLSYWGYDEWAVKHRANRGVIR